MKTPGRFGATKVAVLILACVMSGSALAQSSGDPAVDQTTDQPQHSARETPLDSGAIAPAFTLESNTGESVTLASFRGKKTVVLYFYPKDETPGCTREAQDFRDDYERFKKAGAVVLGVSVDDLSSHKMFAKKTSLTFPILSDVGGVVARDYGVMGWIMAKRATFVIGRDGRIKHAYPDVNVAGHSKAVLHVVQELGSKTR